MKLDHVALGWQVTTKLKQKKNEKKGYLVCGSSATGRGHMEEWRGREGRE